MSFNMEQYLIETVELSDCRVRVTFADGMRGEVPVDELSVKDELLKVNQDLIETSGGRRVEFLTSREKTIEYPWDFFRRIMDDAFSEIEEEESRDARKALGNHLKNLREEKSLSQQELADRAGLDRTTISRLERGKHQAGFDTLRSIAAGLQVSIQEVVNIDEVAEEHAA